MITSPSRRLAETLCERPRHARDLGGRYLPGRGVNGGHRDESNGSVRARQIRRTVSAGSGRKRVRAWRASSPLAVQGALVHRRYGRDAEASPFSPSSSFNTAFSSSTALFKLRDRVGREFLRLGQFVGILDRFVLEPLEAVELELAFLDLADMEAAPSIFLRVARLTLGAAVGIARRSIARTRRSAPAQAVGPSW